MLPTIEEGQCFLVTNFWSVNINDIVVVKHPKRELYLVKRIKSVLENGKYLVEGDNPAHSEDSRKFGFVKKEQIVGKLSFCYWPLEKFGFVKNGKHRK